MIKATTGVPKSRIAIAAVNCKDIVIMGGANGNNVLNDVAIFDTVQQSTR